jgi:signal transduction histidine kinase
MVNGDVHPLALLLAGNPGDRALCRQMLRGGAGDRYVLSEAATVAEALERCRTAPPDCVVTGYALSDGTGLDLIAALAGPESRPAVPVVLLSGTSDERIAVEAMKAGARDCLFKIRLSGRGMRRAVANAVERGRLEGCLRENQARLEGLNRDLARKNADIQSFYHTVSHELKTPLTVIREFAMILADELSGPVNDEQRAYLHIVRNSCDRMSAMINDLLDSSRLENGKLAIHPVPTDVGALARDVVAEMQPLALEKGITLAWEAAGEPPQVPADPCRIHEVLVNLLSNALKFTEPGGRVTVRVAPEGEPPDGVRVDVTDTGVGIPTDQVPHLFERFFQGRNPDLEGMGGLGLGLNICKGLVTLHGGHMDVDSRPGEGSRFGFTLPVNRKEEGRCEPNSDRGGRAGPRPGAGDPVAVEGL